MGGGPVVTPLDPHIMGSPILIVSICIGKSPEHKGLIENSDTKKDIFMRQGRHMIANGIM